MSSNSTNSTSSSRVSPQGGILEGGNPTIYDTKNPIILFIIQAVIIIVMCRLIHIPLSRLRQPRVISEVVGGIILGPSVFGHIPNFQSTIFPTASLTALNLVANLGLVLFLFIIGLETNLRFLVSNWRVGLSVSALGMILPFGLGCAIAYGLYDQFRSDPGLVPINFGTYMLFIGIAMAITAFPVLCRILTELKLLGTNVGVIVLSAGVGNDITGWILLALCVALVNAGSGLTALWVLFVCFGYVLFLFLLVRPLFRRYLAWTGSLENGPSEPVVVVTLVMALASAFFTQVIGVHAIFGGFLIGLMCPHDGGFAIHLTEKVEDLVTALFLPLYFALSGLQTNLGLLNTGIIWGYVIGVIAIALSAKIVGGTLAARATGLLWRESLTVGVLMSCKGLVELIVLNIGLQAKILSTRTFTIFVVMALITTFATTPLTTLLYPKWYQVKVDRWRRGEIDWDETPSKLGGDGDGILADRTATSPIRSILVYLRLDGLPGMCSLVSLLGAHGVSPSPHVIRTHPGAPKADAIAEEQQPSTALQVYGIRLLELTERLSSTMKVSDSGEYCTRDPVVNTFRAFGQMNSVPSHGQIVVVPEHSYADTVVDSAREVSADLVLIPWSESGGIAERLDPSLREDADRPNPTRYDTFVSALLPRVSSAVGILVDRGTRASSTTSRPLPPKRDISTLSIQSLSRSRSQSVLLTVGRDRHLFFPFFGGRDDRFALRLVLQLAKNEAVTATVVYIHLPSSAGSPSHSLDRVKGPIEDISSAQSLPIPAQDTQDTEADASFFAAIRDSLPATLTSRVVFRTLLLKARDANVIPQTINQAREEMTCCPDNVGHIIVVGRRSAGYEVRPLSPSSGDKGSDRGRVLGVVGDALLRSESGLSASVLVVQAPTAEV